ncbi:hypothetical protein COY93_02785 [Candidatus Uhrbacteria bacterium CG_4_10_14_0_8_um_filter_58_22]|uniref:Uncharacterized protein n=1 Tax=Candidatus Uhrbacteria bacterium CG_4_10_14_0_8_um_filter_58_22 TaxID=1975029 RepID=A0A2M7QAT6_9BACT|nr:MAG: hypothetical protein AUJ19_00220 [Parcubacteria group bacterium CG1_02_58_44]PIY62602.1 MAG: hypothetical protein COY93_02785 [Candidatus Uhrbacteria bacterium CG_4_10_14_0_8_um_filter_58_22]
MQGCLGTLTFRKSYLKTNDRLENRPLRRRFLRYDLEVVESGLELVDRYEEHDTSSGQYVVRESRTELDMPTDKLRNRLVSDSRSRQLMAAMLSDLRREIDRNGLKIFLDPQADGTLRPKWRYRCRGRWQTDQIAV